ncbi:ABC transporter permease [Achromobacter sp. 413638]|uniref:ABC transporter permease n=1 Tax=Achromobacter sp. 413638 TaxID=3342385 RepID=UPI003709C8C3
MSQTPAAPPGAVSAVSVSSVSSAAAVATGAAAAPGRAPARQSREALRAFLRNPSAVVGLLLLAAVLAVTLFGPALMPADPFEIVSAPMEPPGAEFLLGTDYLGRDVLTGLVHGGRATLLVGVVAAVLSVLIGVTVGALAGYYGGWIDEALMRVTEFFQVLPTLLFAMVLVTLFSPSLATIAIAIGVVSWTGTARLARGEFLRLKRREYVLAERVIGAGDARIIWRVILPNALAPLIVSATLAVGTAVLFEAGLSFLGLGDPNVMSWGLMIGSNRPYILTAWWAVTLPGAAIFLTVLAVSLIGDGLNDALNPASRGRL